MSAKCPNCNSSQLSFLTILRVSLLRNGGTVSHTISLVGEAVLVPALAFVHERVAVVIAGIVED